MAFPAGVFHFVKPGLRVRTFCSKKTSSFFLGEFRVCLRGLRLKMAWIAIQPSFNAEFTEADAEGGEPEAESARNPALVKKTLTLNLG